MIPKRVARKTVALLYVWRISNDGRAGRSIGCAHLSEADFLIYQGACHCRRVTFEVEAPDRLEVEDCNCSICSKSGFLHLIVPKSRFALKTGEQDLTTYQFNTGVAKHLFCRHCGVKPFYIPRSNPDGVDIKKNKGPDIWLNSSFWGFAFEFSFRVFEYTNDDKSGNRYEYTIDEEQIQGTYEIIPISIC